MADKSVVVLLSNILRYQMELFNCEAICINLLKPTGHVMHQQFNVQQLYVLPTLYLCVLYLSENKQRLVPLTA
jgi:hypothetical protein